jgi:GntR family transcriptional repressor for pyruvate dehydrogenase complex
MSSSLASSDAVLAVLSARADLSGDSYRRAARVFGALSQSILTGYLAPKTKLPSETELARHFRVSRPVVREALKRLRDEALIESVRGSGSYVRLPPEAALAAPTTSAEISHILHGVELRLVIEPEAAALAALRRSRDDLQRLALTVDAFARATAAGEPTHAHDYGFHEAISRATANPRLLSAIRALEFDVSHAVQVWRHLGRIRTDMRMEDAVDEHRAILESIRQQDAEGARRAMRGHIEKARVRMMARG